MYRASIENRGDSRFHAVTRNGALVLDTEGGGANPVDLLLASLCGCVGHYVRACLRDRQIASRGFTVDAEASTTPDETELSLITLSLDLPGVTLDEPTRAALLGYVERCKVLKIVRRGTEVVLRWGRAVRPNAATAGARGEG